MISYSHKHGDTFIARCTYLDASGVATDYAALGITIASQVRRPTGQLVSDLVYTAGAGVGEFVLRGATTAWPLGRLHWDIQFSIGAEVFSTETAAIELAKDVTE